MTIYCVMLKPAWDAPAISAGYFLSRESAESYINNPDNYYRPKDYYITEIKVNP